MSDTSDQGAFVGRDVTCVRAGRTVFEGLSFTLQSGEALILRGPNGSGKSSLLRLLAGLGKAAAGQLHWDGFGVTDDAERHRSRLHYLGHHDGVKPMLSAAENLTLWTELRGGHREAVLPALERLDLAALADIAGRLLSAGQKRRLALCRLVTVKTALWLLDEPNVGLDSRASERLLDLMKEHCAEGGRLVVATHDDLSLPRSQTVDLGELTARTAARTPEPELVW